MNMHQNARLTPNGRELLIQRLEPVGRVIYIPRPLPDNLASSSLA